MRAMTGACGKDGFRYFKSQELASVANVRTRRLHACWHFLSPASTPHAGLHCSPLLHG
jgi:hypothetical protein